MMDDKLRAELAFLLTASLRDQCVHRHAAARGTRGAVHAGGRHDLLPVRHDHPFAARLHSQAVARQPPVQLVPAPRPP